MIARYLYTYQAFPAHLRLLFANITRLRQEN